MTTQSPPLSRTPYHGHSLAFTGVGAAIALGVIATYAAFRLLPDNEPPEASAAATGLAPGHAPAIPPEVAYSLELAAMAEANAIHTPAIPPEVAYSLELAAMAEANAIHTPAIAPEAAYSLELAAMAEANAIRAATGLEQAGALAPSVAAADAVQPTVDALAEADAIRAVAGEGVMIADAFVHEEWNRLAGGVRFGADIVP